MDLRDPWWRGRAAIVTGASSGIGLATAEALMARGCRVGLVARSADRLAAIAERWGVLATPLPADVCDRAGLQRQIQTAIAHWGRIDVLICCAGVLHLQICDEIDDRARQQFETNTLGALWATQAVVPAMRQARFGRIVYVGSIAGLIAPVGFAGYAMSKWALRALAESLRSELRPAGIRVSLVMPTYVRTPMLDAELQAGPPPAFDPRSCLTPDAVATAIVRVARTGQREVILASWSLRLGLLLGRLLPGVQDLVMARLGQPMVASRNRLRAAARRTGSEQPLP